MFLLKKWLRMIFLFLVCVYLIFTQSFFADVLFVTSSRYLQFHIPSQSTSGSMPDFFEILHGAIGYN